MKQSLLLLPIAIGAAALSFGCGTKENTPETPSPAPSVATLHLTPQQIVQGQIEGIKSNPRLSSEEKASLISHIKAGTMPGYPKWKTQAPAAKKNSASKTPASQGAHR